MRSILDGNRRDYFAQLFQDRSCRVVVMKGAGRAYCAGLDIKDHRLVRRHLVGDLVSKATWLTFTSKCGIPSTHYFSCSRAASGGGFAFALASDIRIAESMKMNSAFIKMGLLL